jgi:hypothetical protein
MIRTESMWPLRAEQDEVHRRARTLADDWQGCLQPAELDYVRWIAGGMADQINVADARAVARIWARLLRDLVP